MYKTKEPKPKIIDDLIDVLLETKIANDIAKKIKAWKPGDEISPEDEKQIERWIREPTKDVMRSVARRVVKCIWDYWVVKV